MADVVDEIELTDDEESAPTSVSPYDMPGDWYVIHSYSGYENKVKVNLETRIRSMHMEDRIFEVHIPMEDVVEIKNGKKVTVLKKVFPGYILVRMILDDDSWYGVRNTPGVTGFVGGSNKPTPLSGERSSGSSDSRRKKRNPSRASSRSGRWARWSESWPVRSPISTARSKASTWISRRSPCW
jgi:hypothetical protein